MISYTSNELNQYVSRGGVSFAYDQNGNLTGDGTWSYEYDCENRLIEAGDGTTSAVYQYDAFGRRISKSVSDSLSSLLSTCCFLYDGDHILCEYDENGTLLRKYIYGPGIDEPVSIVTRNQSTETRYYYHADGLGSIIGITDQSGSLIEQYQYDAFGRTQIFDTSHVLRPTSAIGNPFGFTGRELDSETGLYYYRARMYAPELGRFLQVDPVGYYDGMNLYSYCSNDPVNWVDPWGLIAGVAALKGIIHAFPALAPILGPALPWIVGGGLLIGGAWGIYQLAKVLNNADVNPEEAKTREKKCEKKRGETVAMIGETWDPRILKAIPLYQQQYPNTNVETFNAPEWLKKNKNNLTFAAVYGLNAIWIISQMVRGRKMVDIGPDPASLRTKPFYAMEKGLTRFYFRREDFPVPF